MTNFSDFTGLFSLSKTLRFELEPFGKTQETFEQWLKEMNSTNEEGNLFAKDKKIKDAYLVIKPIMDSLHEQFIELSLTSEESRKIDFSQYFEAHQKKDAEKFEKELRGKIGETYQVAGKHFSKKISEAIGKDFKTKKPFECLSDAKMLKYLSKNVKKYSRRKWC